MKKAERHKEKRKGEMLMERKNGIAIAIYSFFLISISIFLISAGQVTALIGFGR